MKKENLIKKYPIIFAFLCFIFIAIFCAIIGSLVNPPENSNPSANTQLNQNKNIEQDFQEAINIVSPKLTGLPDLDINLNDLQVMENPLGEGIFVYVPQTDFYGLERFFLWLVIDNNAYALNGATKDLTPLLSFPRDANEIVWAKTGLDKYIASEAIEIVFNK